MNKLFFLLFLPHRFSFLLSSQRFFCLFIFRLFFLTSLKDLWALRGCETILSPNRMEFYLPLYAFSCNHNGMLQS
jgi:hypothetical protein